MHSEENEQEEKAYHHEVEVQMPKVGLAGHNWQQHGPILTCKSCPYEHSQFIPPDLIYKGLDDRGLPRLEKVK